MMLTGVWPLFGLELRTERLVLRPPTDDDFPGLLDAIDAGIHDPSVMPFTHPWTDAEPGARRKSAVQHWWGARASWSADDWRLPMLVVHADRAVGIQDLFAREFPTLREVRSGSWLTQSVQGNGLGREMRSAVLDLAFHGLGAVVARSDAFAHNDASTSVSRALGYRENGRSRVLSRGKPAEKIEFELTREAWLAARGPASRTRIEGLEPCRPMFAESGVR